MYVVTGATGFVGKHFLDALTQRGESITCVVREQSSERFDALVESRWPRHAKHVARVAGDLAAARCGVSDADIARLAPMTKHVVHIAAAYDMNVSSEEAERANVQGTEHAIALAEALGATLHYVSSIVVAGDFRGRFDEEMLDEGQKHRHPYFRTKFEAEKRVRAQTRAPYRIYRPGIVIGSSETGEAEKIDGIYYAFKTIQRIRHYVPEWMPLVGFEGGPLPIVPVDYVAKAMDALIHAPGLDGRTFHLVDPKPPTLGEALNIICKAAHAPQFAARIDRKIIDLFPKAVFSMIGNVPAVKTARRELLGELGIPDSVLPHVDWRARFDTRDTLRALEPSGVTCPRFADYAWRIWDFWERQLDPDLHKDRSLRGAVGGKIVMVTGASSGIGRDVAKKVARAGATAVLVSRSEDKLQALADEIRQEGGKAEIYPTDLSVPEECQKLARRVVADLGGVDILVNNAGRSIRRKVKDSLDRFHDFQRTMALNYFGPIALLLELLPSMLDRGRAHVINVSSMGVQTNVPRFSAYVASKAALDAFSRCAAGELIGNHVEFTTVYMPLVRTPMIAPTKIYDAFPAITPDEAAELITEAMVHRPKEVATRVGTFAEMLYAVAPKISDRVLHFAFRLFPDSAKKKDNDAPPPEMTGEAVAVAHLLKGLHL